MAVRPQRDALVGREREIGILLAALDDAARGRGRLLLLGGDPGIGKTRLADELATRARDRGHLVLWGRGWEDAGAPAYWPWVQILRACLRAEPTATIQERLGQRASALGQIVPELSASGTPEAGRPVADADSARYRLFDAVSTLLLAVSTDRPEVIVIDDLHAADAASILLLRFLAGQLADARVLVLATYRDAELAPGHPLIAGLAELAREPTTRVLPIGGISVQAIAELLSVAGGTWPRPAVVRMLQRATGGNPLFLGEAVRMVGPNPSLEDLAGMRVPMAMPHEVREVIGRRISPLGGEAVELLRLAAALGPEFSVEPLCQISGRSRQHVTVQLTTALRAGLVVDLGGAGRFRFAHDLVRETLYAEIPSIEAVQLHGRIASALETLDTSSGGGLLAELAYHFARSLPGGDAAKATDYAARAGRAAARALAFEEAARLFRLALDGLDAMPAPDARLRRDLLLELGDAEARAGDLASAQEAFLAAADIARSIGEATDLARAALGYGGRFIWSRAGADPHVIPLLQAALAALPVDADVRLRIRLMARLACAWRSAPEHRGESDRLTRQALELARELDDPSTLSYALAGRFWATYWPENPRERLAIAREILAVARETGDGERQLDGHQTLCIVDLDLGWIQAARSEIEAARRVAADLRQPTQIFAMRTYEKVLALLAGSYAAAEAMLTADRVGLEINPTGDRRSTETVHLFLLRREQARAGEVETAVRRLVRDAPWYPYFRSVLACLLLDEDRIDEARSVFDDLAHDDFQALYPDCQWLVGVCLASEACARLGDAAAAGVLYRQLAAFEGRHAVAHAEGSVGSVDRYLGLLAGTMGHLDDAERLLAAAIQLDRKLGAVPWSAHDMTDRAGLLRRRGAPGDAALADRLEEDARAIAGRIGMVALLRRLPPTPTVAGIVGPAPSTASGGTHGDLGTAVFRREGEYWAISFGGVECRLRDSKGMRYLAQLLAEPGRDIAALDLARGGRSTDGRAAIGSQPSDGTLHVGGFGDAGPVLDDVARRAYRERINELDGDIDEAESWNDAERLARLRAERSMLVQQLAAAVGLRGRARVAGSPSERARMSVAKAIRSSLSRINAACPPLGRHLTVAVHTGALCAYLPDPALRLTWRV